MVFEVPQVPAIAWFVPVCAPAFVRYMFASCSVPETLPFRIRLTVIPRTIAPAGIAKPNPLTVRVAPVLFEPTALVAYTLSLAKTLFELVQPAAEPGARAGLVVSGPEIVTVPPTSTVVPAPVIAPPLTRQRSPRVPMFVTIVSVSIVRQDALLSW